MAALVGKGRKQLTMSEQTRLLDNPLVLAVPVKLLFGFRPEGEGECVARINVNVLGSSVAMSAFLSMRLWGRLVIVPMEPPCDAGTYGRRLERTLNSLTQALAAHAVARGVPIYEAAPAVIEFETEGARIGCWSGRVKCAAIVSRRGNEVQITVVEAAEFAAVN